MNAFPASLDENTARLEERVYALEAALRRETEARQKAEARMRDFEVPDAAPTTSVPSPEDAPFLRALLDNIDAGIMACNTAGELVLFNRCMGDLLGKPLDNVPAEHWAEHYGLHSVDGHDILPLHEVPLVRALEGQTVEGFELMLKPAHAPHRVLVVSAQPIVDAQGRHLGAVCIAHDISASKQTEDVLRVAETRLSTLLANLPVIVFAVDTDGIFTFSDGLGLASLGVAPGAVVGLSAYELYQDYPLVANSIRKTLRGEHNEWQSEVNGVTFQTRCAPLYDAAGQVCGATGVALDVTERSRREEASHQNQATHESEA